MSWSAETASAPAAPIRILIVEDQRLIREGLEKSLSRRAEFAVVGKCGGVNEALELAERISPEVVLLDYQLDGERNERFLREASGRGLAVRVLVLTAWVSQAEAKRLEKAGAHGIISKDRPLEELCAAIRAVARGRPWFRQRNIAAEIPLPAERERGRAEADLSQRQTALLRCLLSGMADEDIAVTLGITPAEAGRTLRGLLEQAGVRTRRQLVRKALELKWM